MDLGLDGKIALVTAASKGLGKASALSLAREGAQVAICSRTQAHLRAAAADIREQTGAEVLTVAADLASAAGVEAAVATTTDRLGGVDVLICNSGGPAIGRFADLTDDQWRAAFDIVTLGFVRMVRAVLPAMRVRKWGRIVGIQSSSVKQPVSGIDLSNGTRPGIAGLSKALATDLAADGITINLVLPGRFATSRLGLPENPANDPALAAQLTALSSGIPVGRLGEPGELGDLVAFLASARAAYITGTVCQIDGGLIASNV